MLFCAQPWFSAVKFHSCNINVFKYFLLSAKLLSLQPHFDHSAESALCCFQSLLLQVARNHLEHFSRALKWISYAL